MREDVLIILNEREPLKAQMAALLAEELESRNLSHQRLKPSPHLSDVVMERVPKVLVVDYLLGDEGTALDLLAQLRERDESAQITTIVWTDERSVNVAVTAMKLGAGDYLELGGPKDVEKLLGSIEEALNSANVDVPKHFNGVRPASGSYVRPIAQAAAAKACLASAETLAKQRVPVITICGPIGSGRNTTAEFIHGCRRNAGSWIAFDLENWFGAASDIFGGGLQRGTVPFLSTASTVFLEHMEFDAAGELLNAFCERKDRLFPSAEGAPSPLLIIGTSSLDTARAWERLAGARLIILPSLAERKEDVLPLVQRFAADAKQVASVNKLDIGSHLIEELEKHSWPGNIRELKSCIIDALTTPLTVLRELYPGEAALTDQQLMIRAISRSKDQFERTVQPSLEIPSPLLARNTLDAVGWNYRVAAAHLGIGVPQLQAALRVEPSGAHDRGAR